MEKRTAARELALLALFQLPKNPEKLAKTDLHAICLAAVRTLADYARKNLKNAETNFIKVERYLLNQQIDHPTNERLTDDLRAVPIPNNEEFAGHLDRCYESISLLQEALEVPELFWHYNNKEVEEFTISLLSTFINHKSEIEDLIKENSKSWDIERMHKLEKGILKLAVAEIMHSDTPNQVAASEAIRLANKYSTEEGVKFINGIIGDIISTVSHH